MPKRGSHKPVVPVGDPTDPRSFAAFTPVYFEWLRTRNYSEATIRSREEALRRFALWCLDRSLNRPSEITKPIMERFQRYLYHYRKENGDPLSFRHQHHRLCILKGFFKWLTRQNHLLYNPASELDLPRLEKRLPKHILTAKEADQVLNQPDLSDPLGMRDRAILETLYSTGMRRREVMNLRLYDLDVERGTIMVRQGKGKKDRVIPIGERAVVWIEKYLREARPSLVIEPDEGILFLTQDGTILGNTVLSLLVRKYIERADIGKTGSCHLFRHTMATLMLEHGADIRFIQQMLGHAKLDTTEIYTQVSIRQLKAIHTLTHPGARLDHKSPSPPAAPPMEGEAPAEPRPAALPLAASLHPSSADLLADLDAEADEDAQEEAASASSLPKTPAPAAPRSTATAEASTRKLRRG